MKKGANPDSKEVPKSIKASQKTLIFGLPQGERRTNESSCSRTGHCPKLEMKISDRVSRRRIKSHFYYTANDDRVDFRLLIKDFAKEFSTRVE
jgi:cell fate regulator YaaT (PSP1 superfamily)